MAEVVTIVGGVTYLLGDLAATSGAKWSTSWPNGCESASVNIDLAPTTYSKALSMGAAFEVWDGPKRVWAGYVKEFTPATASSPATVHAKGYYELAKHYLALALDGLTPTSTPSVAVDRAIARGLPVTNGGGFSASPVSSADQTIELNTLASLLDQWTASDGKRWAVDENRRLYAAADPTNPAWFFDNPEPLRGVADDDYVTNLYGRYVSALTNGQPSSWSTVTAGASSSGTTRREEALDLRDLGFYSSSSTPTAIVTAELALKGQRYGFTTGAVPAFGELTREGGAPARLGHVKAGEMFRAYLVADQSGRTQAGMTADVVIGRTEYEEGSPTVSLTAVDLAPRTFGEIVRAEKVKRDAEAERFKGDAA